MANTKSAAKRARQNEKRRLRNRAQRSAMRTAVKKTLQAIEAGDLEQAQLLFRKAQSLIARAGRKHVIHPRQAARRISRLNAKLKKLALAKQAQN
ncbi:MAG: 30S ribosomal protein S20 [Zetaproteobacteria bacterium]|nr:MAG: 30S ribosomal protein S20 [Zetaproteobacteria bacterium]